MVALKETLRRALRTFIQTVCGYISMNIVYVVADSGENFNMLKSAVFGLGISAVAAGLAAVMNMPKNKEK